MPILKFHYPCLVIGLFLFLLNGTHNQLRAQNDDIYFESLAPELGLSQITVSGIYQDSKGFMWFGTQNGLNRFDGYHFEVFETTENKTSISNNAINGITEDRNGRIWIATQNGLNAYSYEDGKFLRFYRSQDNKGISHNKVSCIYCDKDGRIWVGTEQGLDCLSSDSLTFTKRTFHNFLFNNRIVAIHDDSYGNLWIGTLRGVVRFNKQTDSYKIFRHNSGEEKSLSDSHVRTIFEDSNKNLWIGTNNGLNIYNPKSENFQRFGLNVYKDKSLTNDAVRCITEDSEKNLLIGTNEGLNIFNLGTKDLKKYNQKKMISGNLNHFFIYSLFIDNAGTVWIGTFTGGVNYYNKFSQPFRYFDPGINFVYGSIGSIIEHKNELWIATGGGGLLNYDLQLNYKGQYLLDNKGPKTYVSNVLKTIYSDGKTIYVSTDKTRLLSFDPDSRKVVNENNGIKNYITDFHKISDEKIWLCTNDTLGLQSINPKTGVIEQAFYRNSADENMILPYATCIVEESTGVYWVGTKYTGLYLYDTNKHTAVRFNSRSDSVSLKSNQVNTLYIDSRNNLWVGTYGGGLSLFDRQTRSFRTFTLADGLQSLNIYGILEDDAGFLWIATLSGVSRYDPARDEFKNYTKGNGFPLQEMSENSFTKLKDGRIIAGGNNGFIVFHPLKIKSNMFVPPVLITDFRLLRSAKQGDKSNHEKKLIRNNEEISLKHDQSSFIIEYTALNYIFPEKNQYSYKLEGFDEEWNEVDRQRIAIYTNLNSGKYIFRVKASNNDGVWNEKGMSLIITVSPPPWRTWWAYVIYFMIMTGFFFLLVHYLKLENVVKIKQIEQENMEKVHQLRIRLFTNFSHELRTPLTLIMGPVEDILNLADLADPVRKSMQMIHKNTHRILFLVNQLMDFRKQEAGCRKLKAAEGKFNKFITEVSMAFNELAIKQKVGFLVKTNEQEIHIWFDRLELEKVFFNLLSNAFKNTPPNGKIILATSLLQKNDLKDLSPEKYNCLQLTKAVEFLEVSISNTGIGIPSKELEKIFDPFYQVVEDGRSSVGTGIGLSLVKGIIDLHHGVVCVESVPGEGAVFRVILPVGEGHLSQDEIIKDYFGSEHINHYLVPDDLFEDDLPEPIDNEHRKYTILVIDDNSDIRNYIRTQLQNNYNIIEAENGIAGIEKAIRRIPDLIISDIMMPGIDGVQLCLKLKNEIHTSHIPIILLTARTTFMHVKEGFEVGADDYITKPFNATMLRLKVKSVISNRERLRQTFGKKLPFELAASETKSVDEQFLKKVYQVIEKNISNADFDIAHFSDEIGMSRANLYRKIKLLTKFSPNEVLKNYRLKVALKYLRETDLSISEISYKTGFNNPAYFTNCFKKVHKVSPSEYLQNITISPNNKTNLH